MSLDLIVIPRERGTCFSSAPAKQQFSSLAVPARRNTSLYLAQTRKARQPFDMTSAYMR